MEEYKLTKEERAVVKEIGLFRIRAKKSVESYKIPDTLIGHIQNGTFIKLPEIEEPQGLEEITKEEKAAYSVAKAWGYNPGNHDGKIRKILEDELNFCKKVQDEDIISIISQDTLDKSKYTYLEKKLKTYIEKKIKPYIEGYTDLLEKAKEKEEGHEIYLKQFKKWLKTGKDEDFPTSKGETRSKERTEEDKKMSMFSKKEIEEWQDSFAKEATRLKEEHEKELGLTLEPKKTEPEQYTFNFKKSED
ncbi:MAG: hypothetical protein Q8O03_05935 [Nanoarchaeota archaeon]|nr:hypothetical protein [Nanoarchaeota archaeon]